jgi:hypothetical protein
MITIAATNQSTLLSDEEVAAICRALSVQGTHHIARAWDLDHVSVQPRSRRAEDWHLEFLDHSDQEGALGYHDSESGLPILRIFAADCKDAGVSPSACASHELAEAMVDPWLRRAEQDSKGRFWACEVGDPVQSSIYEIEGVEVQNFVYPAWFGEAPGKLDALGVVKQPLEVPQGGYAQHFNPSKGWESIGAELGAGHTRPSRRRDKHSGSTD